MDIGQKIRQLRTQNNLTLEELASRSELTKGFLSQVERNLTSPSVSTLEDILEAEDAHLLVLDNLQDPGNLGTILRTAEGAGVTGIIISKESVDIYNPKVIRSTMGSIYRVPFVYVEDLKEAIAKVKAHGIFTYAAHLDGKNSYDKEDYTKKTAFLIGNEGNGLRKEIADLADTWIRIPMQGQVESLNAAIATSVLMFETARQRRNQR